MTIPIYYEGKLVSMNWYRNAHWSKQNKQKKAFHQIIKRKIKSGKQLKKFRTHYKLYTKTFGCDGGNIISMIEKYLLDTLKECKVIADDNLNNHKASSWEFVEIDSKEPRIEVEIYEILDAYQGNL